MSLLGSVFKQLSKATVNAGGEAAEQYVKRTAKKGAKVISGVDPKSLGIKHVSDNVKAFYNAQDAITSGNLTKWSQIGELKTPDGKSLGTIEDFNNEVIRAIDQDDVDAYNNVLGLMDGVDTEIPRFDQANQQLTVHSSLRAKSMAGQDPAQLQAFGRQDKGKIQEVAKKTPNKQQQGQLASATANVTTEPLSDNPNIFMSGSEEIKKLTPPEIGEPGQKGLIEGFPEATINKKQQHHELIKALFSEFIKRGRELGTELDVSNLGLLAKDEGFDLGDKLKAMFFADKVPHDAAHRWSINEGVQPDSTGMRSLDKELEYIRNIDNIDDLTRELKEAIEEIGKPMRDEMKAFQDAWDSIPVEDRLELIRLRMVREAAGKKGSKGYKEAHKVYKAFKDELMETMNKEAGKNMEWITNTRADAEALKLDKLHRQMGNE